MGHLPFTHPYRLMVHGRYSAFHRDCEKSGTRLTGGHQPAWLALVDKVETQEMDVLRLLPLLAILAKKYGTTRNDLGRPFLVCQIRIDFSF
jgi:hypothetical protein